MYQYFKLHNKIYMKVNFILSCFITGFICTISSCNNTDSTKKTVTDTQQTANEKLAVVAPDFKSYPQYLYCKIDGQPYVAYYNDDHIGGITNSLNLPSNLVFSTSADQVQINGKTKISEFDISFYSLPKTGILTSTKDFYAQGHTDFPENGDLKYVSFATKKEQQLTLSTVKDGMLEGTFTFNVVDENNANHVLKITEGVFKLQQGKKTNLQMDKNGDVNMDSMLKSINVN